MSVVPLIARLARSIWVGPRQDPGDGDAWTLLVDSIEDPVRSSPGAVVILQGVNGHQNSRGSSVDGDGDPVVLSAYLGDEF